MKIKIADLERAYDTHSGFLVIVSIRTWALGDTMEFQGPSPISQMYYLPSFFTSASSSVTWSLACASLSSSED